MRSSSEEKDQRELGGPVCCCSGFSWQTSPVGVRDLPGLKTLENRLFSVEFNLDLIYKYVYSLQFLLTLSLSVKERLKTKAGECAECIVPYVSILRLQ